MDETEKKEREGVEAEQAKAEGEKEEGELEALRRELAAKEREAKENYDRFLRQIAELENFKKRMAREKGEALRFASEGLIKDLLPILDNLERATEHAKGGGNGKLLIEGIELVIRGFLEALERYGVKRISAMGERFDPEKHEAIAQVEKEGVEPNTVVEEHHRGYYLFDRLIRPALVSVSKYPESKAEKRANGKVENEGEDD